MDPFGQRWLCLLLLAGLYAAITAAQSALLSFSVNDLEEEPGDSWSVRFLRQLNGRLRVSDRGNTVTAVLAIALGVLSGAWLFPGMFQWFCRVTPLSASLCSFISFLILILLLAVLLHLLCYQLPRRAARKDARKTLYGLYWIWLLLTGLFTPLTFLLVALRSALLRLFRLEAEDHSPVTEDEIRQLVDQGEEKGVIESDEKEMIENIFEFNNMVAKDVMTHRTDVVALPTDAEPKEILRMIRETGLSRFPVYQDDIDDIVGILNARDYLLEQGAPHPRLLLQLLREAYFVPVSVRTDILFRDMQSRKMHLAIVVDEYGGTSGIVTMEDLLEEIVGNIYDEFDPLDAQEITPLGPGLWRVAGSTELDALGEAIGIPLDVETDAYDTLGGLIFSQFSEIPEDGSRPELQYAGLNIHVEKIEDHRVVWALVKLLPSESEEELQEQ